jgi:hypothetical protein
MAFAILKKEKLSFFTIWKFRLLCGCSILGCFFFNKKHLYIFRNNKISSLNETVDFSGAEIVDFSLNNFSCIPELKSKLVLLHGNPIDCAIETLEPFFGFSANRKVAKNLEFVCQTLLFWSFGVFDFEKRRASPFI